MALIKPRVPEMIAMYDVTDQALIESLPRVFLIVLKQFHAIMC